MDDNVIAFERISELRKFDTEDAPFVDDLLSSCLETARQTILYFKEHIGERELKMLNSKAHTARGSCFDVGFNLLGQIFASIELAAKDGQFAYIESKIPELELALAMTEKSMQQLMNGSV